MLLYASLICFIWTLNVRTKEISKEVKKRGGGFTKLCSLSPLLQDFVGETELARTEVMLIKICCM